MKIVVVVVVDVQIKFVQKKIELNFITPHTTQCQIVLNDQKQQQQHYDDDTNGLNCNSNDDLIVDNFVHHKIFKSNEI